MHVPWPHISVTKTKMPDGSTLVQRHVLTSTTDELIINPTIIMGLFLLSIPLMFLMPIPISSFYFDNFGMIFQLVAIAAGISFLWPVIKCAIMKANGLNPGDPLHNGCLTKEDLARRQAPTDELDKRIAELAEKMRADIVDDIEKLHKNRPTIIEKPEKNGSTNKLKP